MLKITNIDEFINELNRECKQEQKRAMVKVIKEFSRDSLSTGMGATVSKAVASKVRNPAPNPLRKILPDTPLAKSVDFRNMGKELLTRGEALNPAGYYEVAESPSSIAVTVYNTVVSKKGFSYPLFHYLRGRKFWIESLGRAMNKLALVFGRFE